MERVTAALLELGNPHQLGFRRGVVHVAGTNGKGSVCAMITSLLVHTLPAGVKIGRFTRYSTDPQSDKAGV